MREEPWQLRLVKKSIKKKKKLKLLARNITADPSRRALDLGCAQGILSYFFRKKGGFWASADDDFTNLKTAQQLLGKNLLQIESGILPFKSEAFDLVVCPDYLEHITNDGLCLEEIERVLKRTGELLLITPCTGRIFILHRLRPLLGMSLEYYGHKREGYGLKELEAKLSRAGLTPIKHTTYSRFFSEAIELILNFLYIKFFPAEKPEKLRDGHIRPATASEFQSREKPFRLYSVIYPLIRLISLLDIFIFFLKGYSLMIWARKIGV